MWSFFILNIAVRSMAVSTQVLKNKKTIPNIPRLEVLIHCFIQGFIAYQYGVEPYTIDKSHKRVLRTFGSEKPNDTVCKFMWQGRNLMHLKQNPHAI